MASWAQTIAELDAAKRGSATFGPYLVDPDGALRLPIEMLTRSGPGTWPVSEAPGWSVLALPDGTDHRQWLPLGSEYFFRGEQPEAAYAPSSHPVAGKRMGGLDALRDVLRGDAFPFASRFFALPRTDYIMNSFVYHPQDMEDLSVFIGYRGHSRRFDEIVTPGIYRKPNAPCRESHDAWIRKSRIACNVLKQRFLETQGKPLTDMEARGILQHHYIIGPTDMLDLSYDLSVAKWFALNTFANGRYSKKLFHEKHDIRRATEETVFIYKVVVRAIGSIEVAGEAKRFLTPGVELKPWDDLIGLDEVPDRTTTAPSNLAPLWSTYPKRQRGFGLRGLMPGELDVFGSILSIREYPFHPVFYAEGWDEIGGPSFEIDGHSYTFEDDSSHQQDHLLPAHEPWFVDVMAEVRKTVTHDVA